MESKSLRAKDVVNKIISAKNIVISGAQERARNVVSICGTLTDKEKIRIVVTTLRV